MLLSLLILSCDPDEAKKKPTTQDQDDKNPTDPTTKPADKPVTPPKPIKATKLTRAISIIPVDSLDAVSSKTAANDGGEDARTKADTSGTELGWVFQDKKIIFSTSAKDKDGNEIPAAQFTWEWRKRDKETTTKFGHTWTEIKGQTTATATLTIPADERIGAYELRVSATSGKKTVNNHKTPRKFTVRKSGCPVPSAINQPANLAELEAMVTGSSPSVTGEDLNAIDTSKITTMNGLFDSDTSFNSDINCWDVSNVTTMFSVFSVASSFNQNIGDWDVSNVTNMHAMFGGASAFNNGGSASIGNWDVSSVTDMGFMFYSAAKFNQDLSGWDVSKVSNKAAFANGTTDWKEAKPSWRP